MSFFKIPQRRVIVYLLFLILLPHFFLLNYLYKKKELLDTTQREAEQLERIFYKRLQKGSLNESVACFYQGAETRHREFLIEKSMKAKFIEGKAEKRGALQEVPVHLASPLYLNSTELKELLALIEDKAIPPYESKKYPGLCLITDITLKRFQGEDKQQMLVNFKMLKREFS